MDFDNTTFQKDIDDLKTSLEDSKPKEPRMSKVDASWVDDTESRLDEPEDTPYEEVCFDTHGNMVDGDGNPIDAFPEEEFTAEGEEILD